MQNLVVVLHTECVHIEDQKIWWMPGTCSLGVGAWPTLRNTLRLPMYYHSKFDRSRSNQNVSRRSPKFWVAGASPLTVTP